MLIKRKLRVRNVEVRKALALLFRVSAWVELEHLIFEHISPLFRTVLNCKTRATICCCC